MKRYCISFLIFASSLFGSVEQSVLPIVDSLYQNLPNQKKFTAYQIETLTQAFKRKEEKIRVATFNTLFDLYDNNLPEAYRWPQRKARVVEMICHLQPDVLGVQEVYPNQLEDLLKGLGEKYAFVGVPEKDGECNGIFYNLSRFTLISFRHDDRLNVARLKDKVTGSELAFCNTHLSFSNPDKREAQARRIHQIVQEILLEESLEPTSLILTGDMNTFPNYPCLPKLPFFDGNHIESILKGDILVDARDNPLLGHVGSLSTFSNEGEDPTPFKGSGTPGVFLDHIYVSKEIAVLVHAIDAGRVDGLFPSDHLPVIADILIP